MIALVGVDRLRQPGNFPAPRFRILGSSSITGSVATFQHTMKTTKKQTQCQRLLAYLRKNRKGITTMEAFQHLGITCVHKRIAELEEYAEAISIPPWIIHPYRITRTPERTATGSTVTRYKLAR